MYHGNENKNMNWGMYHDKFHDYCRKMEKRYDLTDEKTKQKIRQGVMLAMFFGFLSLLVKIAWHKKHYEMMKMRMGGH